MTGLPFAVLEGRPDGRQALGRYRAVVTHHRLPVAPHEEMPAAAREGAATGV